MSRDLSPEKRAAFLAAALRLFAANGVQNTSTAEIAKAAGTAAGTLFLYFPTKQDLIHALVIHISREQSAVIHALLDGSAPARETFWTIWQGSLNWFLEHPLAYQYVQQVRDSSLIAESVVQESNQYFDYYYLAIQKGVSEGVLRPYPLELIGGMLYQDIVAVMNLIRMQPDPARQQELIRQGFDIFWQGVCA